MQTQKRSVARTQGDTIAHAESLKLTKRIGSTTFTVSVHFSQTSKETVEDKLLRLMERDVGEMYSSSMSNHSPVQPSVMQSGVGQTETAPHTQPEVSKSA